MIARNWRERIFDFMGFRGQVMAIVAMGVAILFFVPFRASAVLQDSVWVVTFTPSEALESKLRKAAHVRPSPAQIKWMERERNAFMHYGMNTFHGADWGTGSEAETDFAPTAQNPTQWAQTLKNARFSMVVPTAKHHDGFCIWNTATTQHSIQRATVKTDVISAFHTGLVGQGVDLGIYLSPWDMNQRNAGCWTTNASDTTCYNNLFINQLRELLGGNYGPIGELWFDGACGDYPIWQPIPGYRVKKWYDTIEALQPNAVIRLYDGFYFSGTITDSSEWVGIKGGTQKLKWRGKEIRWCGNEGGAPRADEWSVIPVYKRFFGQEQTDMSLGLESYYNNAVGALWYQSEINTSIAVDWFWHSGSYSLKSLATLKTLYINSIGNNSNLLLNLLPDNRGLIPDNQVTLLRNWSNWIDSTFTRNWANGATAAATAAGGATAETAGHEANKIIDNKRHTYWTTGGTWNISTSTATVTFTLPAAQTFDHVMIKEYVYNGQRVAGWNLEYQDAGGTWRSLVTGKRVIGYKKICQFTQVSSSRVRLNITRSWDHPEISNFALYRTLSGIDLTPEDTTPSVAVMPGATAAVSFPVQPKITVNAHRLAIDAMGLSISRIEIVGLDGRSVQLAGISGSKAVSRPLTPGVYLVKIQAGGRSFQSKIAVSR